MFNRTATIYFETLRLEHATGTIEFDTLLQCGIAYTVNANAVAPTAEHAGVVLHLCRDVIWC